MADGEINAEVASNDACTNSHLNNVDKTIVECMSLSGKNNSLTHSLVHSAVFTNHLANVWTGGAVCAQ